jgi:hypothetical protein
MDDAILRPDLWQGYTRLMRAYGNRWKSYSPVAGAGLTDTMDGRNLGFDGS